MDDRATADEAYGLACQGVGLLWKGDFHNARQMLVALGKRADRQRGAARRSPPIVSGSAEAFHRYRQGRAQRARTLNALLIELDDTYGISLRRAPSVRAACEEAFGPPTGPTRMPLRAILGAVGAHEWRTQGIEVPALGARIHPYYGVFAPIRSEYLDLVATAPLPAQLGASGRAFDIGTGTGVLAAVLARRGIRHIVATDLDPNALRCATDNLTRLGMTDQVEVLRADLFPPGRATLVTCNPPWLPARPSSPLEMAIYDPDGRMLQGFLSGLHEHLEPEGEGWLILSDLAEHLGLRSREQLLAGIEAGGLRVVDRHDIRPRHARAADPSDPLHAARAAEVTSLWRLAAR